MPDKPWDNQERRVETKDHDTLIQMVQILQNHVDNFKNHVSVFDVHVDKDEKSFDNLRKDNQITQRMVWMAAGAVMAVQALPVILRTFHILNK